MTCGNCAQSVTTAIQSVPEVNNARISLNDNRAVVNWNASKNVPAVLQAVKNAGYEAKEITNSGDMPAHNDWQAGPWLGIVVTALLMVGEWIFQVGMTRWYQWTSFVLAAIV